MKNKKFVILVVIMSLVVILSGCGQIASPTDLSSIALQSLNIEEDSLNSIVDNNQTEQLLITLETMDEEENDASSIQTQVIYIRSLRQNMRLIQTEINQTKQSIQVQTQTLRTLYSELKDHQITLTPEEKQIIMQYRSELRTLRQSLLASKDQGYTQLRALRGQYQLENIDVITSVHESVLQTVASRDTSWNRIHTILNEVIILLETRIATNEN